MKKSFYLSIIPLLFVFGCKKEENPSVDICTEIYQPLEIGVGTYGVVKHPYPSDIFF